VGDEADAVGWAIIAGGGGGKSGGSDERGCGWHGGRVVGR
jgi:hypothetical protein